LKYYQRIFSAMLETLLGAVLKAEKIMKF